MADEIRFSELPNADLPLVGSEIVALVQNGVSKKVKVSEVKTKLPVQVQPNLEHDGNQSTGAIFAYEDPWLTTPQKRIFIKYPWLNIDEKYELFLTKYALTQFRYDTYSFGPPYEINIDVPQLLGFQSQLYGVGYTLNVTSNYLGDLGQANAATINAPNCIGIRSLGFWNNYQWTLNFPQLKWSEGQFTLGGTALSINLPLLECVGGLSFQYTQFGMLPTLSLPSLKYCTYELYFYNPFGLTTIDLPQLKILEGRIYIDNASSLTTLNIPNLVHFSSDWGQRRIEVYNTPLNQATVDQILIRMDATGQNNGNVNIGGLCSAPSGAGLTAKTNLINKGWNVITN